VPVTILFRTCDTAEEPVPAEAIPVRKTILNFKAVEEPVPDPVAVLLVG
jgi:hypothetical protein